MEEDVEKIENFILVSKKTFGESTELAFAWRRLKDKIEELQEKTQVTEWQLEHSYNTGWTACEAVSVLKPKIQKLKEENEKKIDAMRQFKHSSPFDFGVLNGIDECCRILLEDK